MYLIFICFVFIKYFMHFKRSLVVGAVDKHSNKLTEIN
jgi:hypothetical protein